MSEIRTLVGEAAIPVALDTSGEPRHVPEIVGASAYRVIRAALDAAVSASEASEASVAIEYVPGALVIQVDDDGGGRCSSDFAELRELAAALGGGLRATAGPDGFRVRAWLPTEGQPPSPAAPPAPR